MDIWINEADLWFAYTGILLFSPILGPESYSHSSGSLDVREWESERDTLKESQKERVRERERKRVKESADERELIEVTVSGTSESWKSELPNLTENPIDFNGFRTHWEFTHSLTHLLSLSLLLSLTLSQLSIFLFSLSLPSNMALWRPCIVATFSLTCWLSRALSFSSRALLAACSR